MSEERSLHRKLAQIMAEVERVPKRGHNAFHNYDYPLEADILDVIRKQLAEKKVTCLPSVTGHERNGNVTTLLMEYEFTDAESGESVKKPWIGEGEDKADKGSYKALTGSLKYFLLKTFQISTGDDPENDDQGQQQGSQGRSQGSSRPPQPQPTPRAVQGGTGLLVASENRRVNSAKARMLYAKGKAWHQDGDPNAFARFVGYESLDVLPFPLVDDLAASLDELAKQTVSPNDAGTLMRTVAEQVEAPELRAGRLLAELRQESAEETMDRTAAVVS